MFKIYGTYNRSRNEMVQDVRSANIFQYAASPLSLCIHYDDAEEFMGTFTVKLAGHHNNSQLHSLSFMFIDKTYALPILSPVDVDLITSFSIAILDSERYQIQSYNCSISIDILTHNPALITELTNLCKEVISSRIQLDENGISIPIETLTKSSIQAMSRISRTLYDSTHTPIDDTEKMAATIATFFNNILDLLRSQKSLFLSLLTTHENIDSSVLTYSGSSRRLR